MVLCISPTIFWLKSSCLNVFLTSCFFDTSTECFYKTGITYILYCSLCSLNSNATCLYFVCFSSHLVTMLFSCGHAISQIHKIFFSLSSNVKSGLLDVVVFLKLNSKSHTSFAWSFSRVYPLHHFCLYHVMSFSTKLNSLAHEIANIINPLLCLARYLLFANTLHPAKRCSPVLFVGHSLHLLHLARPLEAFHDFVSTICSSIVITEAVFFGVRFYLSHKLQLSPCFRNVLLCICLSRYSSLRFCSTLLFNLAFNALHVSFQSFQSFLHPVRCNLLQNLPLSLLHTLM